MGGRGGSSGISAGGTPSQAILKKLMIALVQCGI